MTYITRLRLAVTTHNVRKRITPQPPGEEFNLLLTQDGNAIITQNEDYIVTQGSTP